MSERASRRSRELFDSGYYCAESVLLAVAESKGIHTPLIPKMATGFCSGLSRTGRMCGAVSGAIMSISLLTGRSAPTDSLEECYAITRKLLELFEQRFGSTNCPHLIGCDLHTEEGRRIFEENHLADRCQRFVEEATGIVMALLGKQTRPRLVWEESDEIRQSSLDGTGELAAEKQHDS